MNEKLAARVKARGKAAHGMPLGGFIFSDVHCFLVFNTPPELSARAPPEFIVLRDEMFAGSI